MAFINVGADCAPQVFEGRLPTALPIVWNPRLTCTAGQVVDDRSQDSLKTDRSQRMPCKLELSPKVRPASGVTL